MPSQDGEKAADYFDLIPAMAVEMEPRDAVEAMLVTQMAATHVAMTQMALKLHHASSFQMREAFERSMTRLSRTFLAQMDQLKRYRLQDGSWLSSVRSRPTGSSCRTRRCSIRFAIVGLRPS